MVEDEETISAQLITLLRDKPGCGASRAGFSEAEPGLGFGEARPACDGLASEGQTRILASGLLRDRPCFWFAFPLQNIPETGIILRAFALFVLVNISDKRIVAPNIVEGFAVVCVNRGADINI